MTRYRLVKLAILLLGVGFASCSTLPPEEAEWRRLVDRSNWELCEGAYKAAGKYTLHLEHDHRDPKRVHPRDIKQDLLVNSCRQVLGDLTYQTY